MARYIGPKIKISRRFGTKLGLRTNEEGVTRRPYKPGMHGAKGSRRSRTSEYGTQLLEKQKAKYIYGVLERQFHRYYVEAAKTQNIGLTLLQILETRLDTVVYRSGYGLTQNQARQFVTHGHVTVNGKKVSIPSFRVLPGMKIAADPTLVELVDSQRGFAADLPTWIRREGKGTEVLSIPTREQISPLLNEQLIVEYYSR
jgi:small subunit ribosomal protein S4